VDLVDLSLFLPIFLYLTTNTSLEKAGTEIQAKM
jgi:hypothetical protein